MYRVEYRPEADEEKNYLLRAKFWDFSADKRDVIKVTKFVLDRNSGNLGGLGNRVEIVDISVILTE